jgi:RNA-directed DNA polymerase
MFDAQDRWVLKLLAKFLNVYLIRVLSHRCFHQWGGAKMMLREVCAWISYNNSQVDSDLNPTSKPCFIYKTDIYSYYASINHEILIQQIKAIGWPSYFLETVIAYCKRTILRIGPSVHCQRGIPKGGSLSPALGALYLTPLDHAMERWMKRGDCLYARFQDDLILISRKRHALRRMKKEMYEILDELRLTLRPEKTFVGRSNKGFDLLGYHITPQGLTPNQTTQEKAFEEGKRRYAQGGTKPLQDYLKRWRIWVHAGLPSLVHQVDDTIQQLIESVISSKGFTNSQRPIIRPASLCTYGDINPVLGFDPRKHMKGIPSCLKNFSRHRSSVLS